VLLQDGFDRVNLSQLVKRAGVARSTVHYQFASRAKLLLAVFEDAAQRAGVDWLRLAWDDREPLHLLELTVLQACQLWSADYPVFRRGLGLAKIDGDADRAVQRWEGGRYQGITHVVRRLDEAQLLSDKHTPAKAVSVLGWITSFWAYDQLLAAGQPKLAIAEILLDASCAIVRPDRASPGPRLR